MRVKHFLVTRYFCHNLGVFACKLLVFADPDQHMIHILLRTMESEMRLDIIIYESILVFNYSFSL